MKKANFSMNLVLWLGLICAAPLAAAGGAHVGTSAPFKLVRGHLIITEVVVNGAGPYEFMLDTGANTTLVTPEFARRLGLRPVDRLSLVTVAGTQAVPRARLQELTLGPKSVTDLEVLLTDLRQLRALHPAVCGVLGQNFLSHFNVLIDYQDRRIEFEEGGEVGSRSAGTRLPFEVHEGRVMVQAQHTSCRGRPLRLVLDSGTPGLILFETDSRPLGLDMDGRGGQSVQAATDLGSRPVWQGRLRKFAVGGRHFVNLPVALVPPSGEGREENGLLPTCLFRSVYINHQERFVIFGRQP